MISYEQYLKAINDNKILLEKLKKLNQEKLINKRFEEKYSTLTEELNKVRKKYTKNLIIIKDYENYIKDKGEDKNDKYKRK